MRLVTLLVFLTLLLLHHPMFATKGFALVGLFREYNGQVMAFAAASCFAPLLQQAAEVAAAPLAPLAETRRVAVQQRIGVSSSATAVQSPSWVSAIPPHH